MSRPAFAAAILFFVFLLGGVFAQRGWQPYKFFADGVRTGREFIRERTQNWPDLLEPIRYAGDGVTVRRDGAWPGMTAIQGLFAEGIEVRLLDMSGAVIHRWRADFHAVWPDPAHVFPLKNVPSGTYDYQTHGMYLLPDGSVVLSFDNLGTAKLDKCDNVLWTVDRATHHAVTPNPDGSFWIPARVDLRKVNDRLVLGEQSEADFLDSSGRYEDSLLLVGADGKTRREISVLKALFNGQFGPELFDVREFSVTDPTHLNDIEVVTPELAARIAGVNPGDLLVSLRQMHMLAILDRQTGAIKWHRTGPWVRQHDPDITADGLIELFNNGDAHLAVDGVVGSSIMTLDPATGMVRTAYPLTRGKSTFFSRIMGSHQLLPNGNRLIAETMAGRVFEVDAVGHVVWQYVKAYDKKHAALLQSAHRYAPDYFTVKDWSCPKR